MALSIGVRGGKRIRIGGKDILKVLEVIAEDKVRVTINGREILVTDLERVQLLPDVFVSCGKAGTPIYPAYARLCFEAPRAIRIERI